MSSRQRIGLFGGTFDPVHNGHLAVANHAKKVHRLDSIWFIPAASPPHKNGSDDNKPQSSFTERVSMLDNALNTHQDYFVSQVENDLPKPSYTVDTLQHIIQTLGGSAELFFLIGVDAFVEIATWKNYVRLPTLANLIVISRPSHPLTEAEKIVSRYYKGYWYDPLSSAWEMKNQEEKIYFMSMKPVPVSSSDIRNRIREGQSINDLVPSKVASYIREYKLYV